MNSQKQARSDLSFDTSLPIACHFRADSPDQYLLGHSRDSTAYVPVTFLKCKVSILQQKGNLLYNGSIKR